MGVSLLTNTSLVRSDLDSKATLKLGERIPANQDLDPNDVSKRAKLLESLFQFDGTCKDKSQDEDSRAIKCLFPKDGIKANPLAGAYVSHQCNPELSLNRPKRQILCDENSLSQPTRSRRLVEVDLFELSACRLLSTSLLGGLFDFQCKFGFRNLSSCLFPLLRFVLRPKLCEFKEPRLHATASLDSALNGGQEALKRSMKAPKHRPHHKDP